MKNWKQNAFFGLVAIIVLIFGFVGCDDGDGKDDPVCKCDPKEHYLPCDCEVAGTDKCTCVVIPRGTVTDKAGNIVPIYQSVGVSNDNAIATATNIATVYNSTALNPYRDIISGKIKEIWILAGDAYSFDKVTGILEMGIDWDSDEIEAWLVYGVVPALQ
jgi:hypothetical protein